MRGGFFGLAGLGGLIAPITNMVSSQLAQNGDERGAQQAQQWGGFAQQLFGNFAGMMDGGMFSGFNGGMFDRGGWGGWGNQFAGGQDFSRFAGGFPGGFSNMGGSMVG